MDYTTDRQSWVLNPANKGEGLNCVFSGGVSRALVSNLGVLDAFREKRLRFDTIGGVSAGAIAPLFAASGMTLERMGQLVMEEDFGSLLERRHQFFHYSRLAWRILRRRSYFQSLPQLGLFRTERLGRFIDEHVPVWPQRYWTMAYTPGAQIIFCERGVFRRTVTGEITQIASQPPAVSTAIRATCALPGFFDAVPYRDDENKLHILYDGYVSWDGLCPVNFVEAFFGVKRSSIIACDVGKYSKPNRLLGGGYGAVICPDPPFKAHHLNLCRSQKILGMAAGYDAAMAALAPDHEKPKKFLLHA